MLKVNIIKNVIIMNRNKVLKNLQRREKKEGECEQS